MNRNPALAPIVAALFISAALCLDRSSAGSTNLVEPGMAGIVTPTPTPIPTLTPFTPSPTPTPLCGSGNWELVGPFPFSGTRMAVASDGVFAYAAGGVTVPQQNTMYRYDPVANSWSALANMPAAFSSSRAVYSPATNSIYVFGGLSMTVPNLDTTYIYNVGTNTWTTGASMPAGRNSVQVAYYSATNKIYVIGGLVGGPNGSQEQSQVWEYDPANNTWDTSRQDAPHGIGAGAVGVQGQYVYIAGGLGDIAGHGSTQHYRYDIVNNSWAALAPLPMPVYYPVGASVGGKNYVIGGGNPARPGESPEAAFRSTFIYDPVTDVWAAGPSTNVAHAQGGGTAIGNRLLVIAGAPGGGGSTNVAEIYIPPAQGCPTPTPVTPTPTPTPSPTLTPTPMTPTPTPTPTPSPTLTPSPCAPGQWMFRANYPIGIYEVAVTADGSSVYAFGGRTGSPVPVPVSAANRYDPVTDTWTALAPVSSGPDNLMGAEYGGNGKIYVMGGAGGPALNRIYDIPSNTWSTGAPIPLGRRSFAHAYCNGKIYVIGGIGSSAVHAYDIASNTWTTRASLPQPRNGTAAGVIDGRIYVAPGYQSETLFIYNIAADSWSVGPSVQVNDSGTAGAVVARKLWVIGGNDAPILIYDPSVSTWSIGPSLNQRRSYPGAATIISQGGETAVVVGGNDTGSFIPRNTVEASSIYGCPTPTPMTPTPTPMTPTPTPTVTPFTPTPFPTPSGGGGSPTPTSTPCACPSPTPTPASTPTVIPTPTVTPTPILRFCSTAPIDMTLNQPAAPYPSTITVAGAPSITGGVIVTLNALWHQLPDNIDVLLVGPQGQKFVLMADAGGPIAIPQANPVTLILRDFQPTVLPNNGPLVSGTFMPTNWETPVLSFAPPAPAAPYVEPGNQPFPPIGRTLFGSFGLTNPNGVWSLYVRDDGGNPFEPDVLIGSISGGWCLEFLPPTAAGVSISGRVMTASGAGIRNARVVVSGNALPESRVVTTGSFGYFSVDGLIAGETYVVTVNSQRYTFQAPSRVYNLVDNITDADFVANEP